MIKEKGEDKEKGENKQCEECMLKTRQCLGREDVMYMYVCVSGMCAKRDGM